MRGEDEATLTNERRAWDGDSDTGLDTVHLSPSLRLRQTERSHLELNMGMAVSVWLSICLKRKDMHLIKEYVIEWKDFCQLKISYNLPRNIETCAFLLGESVTDRNLHSHQVASHLLHLRF